MATPLELSQPPVEMAMQGDRTYPSFTAFKREASQGLTLASVTDRLVVIDPSVEDREILLAGIEPGTPVLLLHPEADGVVQISRALAIAPTRELHLVCHGRPGQLHLGSTVLHRENLSQYQNLLNRWGITEFFLYACEVGQDRAFMTALNEQTGAWVAAARSLVGNPALGGNWVLEDSHGSVVSCLAFHSAALATYPGILIAPTLDLNGALAGINYSNTFIEGGGAVALVDVSNLTVSDPDSSTLTGATIVLTNLFDGSAETLGVNTGSTGISASYSGGVLTLTGIATPAQYQQVLRTLTYNNTSSNPTTPSRTITFTVIDDTGNSSSATTTLSIIAVNNAPVLTVPGAQSVNEDTPLTLAGISVADVDVGSGNLQVTLAASSGILALNSTIGLAINAGGNATSFVTFSGNLTNINAALNGLSYQGNANFNGADTINLSVSDQGNTGVGGAKTGSQSIAVTVNPVNDAPIFTVPGAQSVNEDTPLTLAGISVADVDAGSGNLQVTLAVSSGTLTLNSTSGLTISGGGNGTSFVTFSGNLTDINAALNGLSYQGNANFSGADTLNLSVNDQGNTGAGGALTSNQAIAITVTTVNDAPTNLTLSNNTINENSLKGTEIGTLSTTDGDSGEPFTYQIKTASGALIVTGIPFAIVGNSLQVNGLMNFEAHSQYLLTIQTTDADGAFLEQVLTINVLDMTTNTLVGTPGTDDFLASNEIDDIQTLDGNDIVRVSLGNLQSNDRLDGGTGNDTLIFLGGVPSQQLALNLANSNQWSGLSGTALSNVVLQNFENVTLVRFGGEAQVTGSDVSNKLTGGAGNDTLSGLGGKDVLTGNAGSDVLIGGLGNDLLYLGTNDGAVDQVLYTNGEGSDRVYQFERGVSGDQLRFSGIPSIDVQIVSGNTEFRVGDSIAGNVGFGTGTLLLKTMSTTGFVAGDEGVNLFNLTTPSGGFLFS